MDRPLLAASSWRPPRRRRAAPPEPPPSQPQRDPPPPPPPAADRRLLPPTDEEALLARFRAGDPRALSAVYRRYAPAVLSVAMSVLEDRALADDAVQETFVRAWRAAFRYDPARPLGPWLAAIARRSAIDIYRREMRPTRGCHALEADVASGEDPFDGTWMRWEVRRALDRLPERDRSLMRLLHLEGHTHTQAARLLDVPVGTVKSRSHRAHRRLAEMLAHLAPIP